MPLDFYETGGKGAGNLAHRKKHILPGDVFGLNPDVILCPWRLAGVLVSRLIVFFLLLQHPFLEMPVTRGVQLMNRAHDFSRFVGFVLGQQRLDLAVEFGIVKFLAYVLFIFILSYHYYNLYLYRNVFIFIK